MMGVLKRKAKRAAVARSRSLNNPAVMVIPERETPGIRARAWGDTGDQGQGLGTAYNEGV